MRTFVWRGLDAPRMEIVYVDSLARASGTQIGVDYELRWQLDGPELAVTVIGGSSATLALGDADFFDLGHSAFFNSLPVAQDNLLQVTHAHDYVMRFVAVPELTTTLVPQCYTPRGNRVVGFSTADYQADIHFDADGFVTLYQDYLERLSAQ